MPAHVAAFLVVATLVIATPGPDTALTVRNAVVGGRRGGIATALGVASGQSVWALATAAGVAAILRSSASVVLALKLAGAAYLAYLGLRALRDAVAPRAAPPGGSGETRRPRPAGRDRAYRQGLLSNLANPKMAAFFTSLLPQVASGPHPGFASLLGLGLAFAFMTLGWLAGYAVLVARARRVVERRRVRRGLDAVTGTVLVGLGLRLATERR